MFTKLSSLLKDEFRLENFGLTHLPSDEFVTSQWQTKSKSIIFLSYRWLTAIIFIAAVAISMSRNTDARSWGTWFIYLTNWGVVLCFVTTILGATLVTIWHFHPEFAEKLRDRNKMPLSFQIYWVLHNTALIISIIITIIYWSVLWNNTIPIDATNVLTHLTNSITMFIDLLIVAYPLRLLHFVYPIGFGLIYLLFSLIYYWAGGINMDNQPYIYSVLDWSNAGIAIGTAIGTLALALIMHFVMFGVYKLRSHVSRTQKRKRAILPTSQHTGGVSMVFGRDNAAFAGSTNKL